VARSEWGVYTQRFTERPSRFRSSMTPRQLLGVALNQQVCTGRSAKTSVREGCAAEKWAARQPCCGNILGKLDLWCATEIQSRCAVLSRAPAFPLYQNRIKTLSETTIGVVARAKSRFPRLLERLRKRETEWTDWEETSRAQGRCATRLRYAPTCAAPLSLEHCENTPRVCCA
jgi:hypothetical protein